MPCDTSIRRELLKLLPEVGHKLGLGGASLRYLSWLIERCTKEVDWEPGARAVVYANVGDLAARYPGRVSVRQINHYDSEIICQLKLPDMRSGNGRRYAQRDPATDRIVHAFGFELTGIAEKLPDMRKAKAELDAAEAMRRQRKRLLTVERARVRRLLVAAQSLDQVQQTDRERAQVIAAPICERVTARQLTDVRKLEALIVAAQHAAKEIEMLLLAGKTGGSDVKSSDVSEENYRHLHSKLNSEIPLTGCCSPDGDTAARTLAGAARATRPAECSRMKHAAQPEHADQITEYRGPAFLPPEATGAYMIAPTVALAAASERFRAHLPPGCRPSVGDIEVAAQALRSEVGVGAWAWRQACELVGTYPAALCLLAAERRAADGVVGSIGGYFVSMIRRGRTGTLRLDRSIRGLASPRAPQKGEGAGAIHQTKAEREVRYDA
jgi:DNA-binding transcriptional MerR regulator